MTNINPPLRAPFHEVQTYLKSLQEGERVIECSQSGMFMRRGVVYLSKTQGHGLCVLWDKLEGEGGQMGTSVTGGTRRISDVTLEDTDPEPLRMNSKQPSDD